MDLNESLGILVQEARELLADMEAALLAIEANGVEPDRINALFSAAHTIKGSAGLFGLGPIVSFTHLMESLLVDVRSGTLALEPALSGLLFNCADHLDSLIDCLERGGDLAACEPDLRVVLMESLRDYWQAECPATAATPVSTKSVAINSVKAGSSAEARTWQIQLRFAPDLLAQGIDPQSFFLYLANLGELLSIDTHTAELPALSELDPERCYLTFELTLLTDASEAEIATAFDFAREGSDIRIRCLDGDEPEAELKPVPQSTGVLARAARDSATIKVEARKLDELIDAVGELVIRSASCHAHPDVRRSSALVELMESVGGLVEQIRDRALNLRMVPIGEVFQRFPRVVRDVSQELGKRIDLQISGADTELDKSMVEKLTDPLLHIVRNAMDHGIEPVADRIAAGKPEQGVLALNAYHQSGTVVIEIRDDGRGLDSQKIMRKAVERGLIAPDAKLSDREIFNLIFAAGFSTADQVTDLSGRGVGMDVVRQNIEQLRGTIDIHSAPGAGTRFQIQLPLTLAIIDGFEVAVGDAHFVLPLDMVVECLEFSAGTTGANSSAKNGQGAGFRNSHDIFNLRGQPLPFLRLSRQFAIDSIASSRESLVRECLVVVQCGEQRAGLVVDRFVGEIQAVIKPLGHLLGNMRGFSGSTILGDGSVALLLDIPALVTRAARSAVEPLSLHGAP